MAEVGVFYGRWTSGRKKEGWKKDGVRDEIE